MTSSQVVMIHDLQSAQPLRDSAGLDAAVNRSQAGWGDQLLFPETTLQAAVLLISLCQAQAFVDGNKRTAWVACDVFLGLNNLRFGQITDAEILDLMHRISTHAADESSVDAWIRTRVQSQREETGSEA